MAIIKPFRAIRPTRDKAALATSRTYDEYSKKELKAVLSYNPFSFLHIIKPGYINEEEPAGEERFKKVHKTYEKFKSQQIYQKDEKPQYYLHQKTYGEDTFWGIIAIAHVNDYQNNVIRKHEDTLKQREALFGNYLGIAGFNAEPVLLTYPENTYLNGIHRKYAQQRSEYEFTTHTKRLHKFWIIDDELDIETIEGEFAKMDALYIADGHHRTASSNYLATKNRKLNKNHTGDEQYNYFMTYMVSDHTMKISAFNRFIKDLNGLDKEEFITLLEQNYTVRNHGKRRVKPLRKNEFSMYLDKTYYLLTLKNPERFSENAVTSLDTSIMHQTILKPILKIQDLKTDPRIQCMPAIYNTKQLKNEVDSGNFKVGFGLFPVKVEELKAVVNEGLTMPPKSTYIEPKLRSGLTIFEIYE